MIKKSFGADIAAFKDLTMKKLDAAMKIIAEEGLFEMLEHGESHLFTGWYRASWSVSVNDAIDRVGKFSTKGFTAGHLAKGNRPTYDVKYGSHKGPKEAKGTRWTTDLDLPISRLGKITRDDKVVFSNAVPYAQYVPGVHQEFVRMKQSLYNFANRKVANIVNGIVKPCKVNQDYVAMISLLNSFVNSDAVARGDKSSGLSEGSPVTGPSMSIEDFMEGM